ncbi:phosphoenolpyruvate synthase [Photobacterium phosphoreum]|uniref:Phosphoenolpyruvate synthase n=1 Tax=Photobacterium phosphoreum TaxID=659 RepID=A0AAW4ZKI7_PHOPO|nr:phosphoenolpyruvate synthase [Photobacterium phosphoreum]MCD9490488.1 phosphoenolpyruvate synthase [Photobacterium phosphoreum]MCD9505337.1 phosphoenolpyruvate synthase [Photobacterium phosphoreum]MCF2189641.1 phosphoenolpyruvate synthase [Photobacterium phosphoreum]MCF2301547.1 phosphoenolpyruvate synthase [Photobacterium phosphoreum]OBU30496.1 phosphoenolpyruvate synthase [Photobacterium phosphoreum]
MQQNVIWYSDLSMNDVDRVGGKNASLGEMVANLSNAGVKVPNGYATTSHAFNQFLQADGLSQRIYALLDTLDVDDVNALKQAGATIRNWVLENPLPAALEADIRHCYQQLGEGDEMLSVAVRSSATAEDLPDASFAGQQETFLNVRGIDAVIEATKHVFASLFNDRAISYRVHQGFDHEGVALSAGIQRMVRSDKAASGVMFTLDTESGFDQVVFITSSWGLGEMVVQGAVNPDEFYVHKPTLKAGNPAVVRRTIGSKLIKMVYADGKELGTQVEITDTTAAEQNQFSLTDTEIMELAKQALIIEQHYGRPMDIEWAKDGNTGELLIVQARPETVRSRDNQQVMERFHLNDQGKTLIEGRAIGQRIGSGPVRIVSDLSQMDQVQQGDVLVADMTDPDWEPVMKKAAAIVTNRGGRTCHAAIIARELGIPAVVGCGDAMSLLQDGQNVTVSCAQGETGYVYDGILEFEVRRSEVEQLPTLPLKVMMNVGNPDRAFDFACIPNEGVGLARLEFIINKMIGIHPKALLNYDQQSAEIKAEIDKRIIGYANPVEFYIEKLTEGISTLAAAFWPQRVIVRMSDFKSNEYRNLVGGINYEPTEENPMLGFRGASRYIAPHFQDCFALECEAIKRVREKMGLKNVEIMIPFVRTVSEAASVIDLLAKFELRRGENGLKVMMMCELPSNAILAEEFLKYFDGFSIGSNDMTQLTLGLDRDSGDIAHLFDERNDAVKAMLSLAIKAANKAGKYVGICGQGPSDHEDFARWLMDQGIDSVSLNPDTVLETWTFLGKPH